MLSEVNILGIYVSPLVIFGLLVVPVFLILRVALARTGVLRFVWHPVLFQVSLLVCLFALAILAS
jgi:hypothetical protein